MGMSLAVHSSKVNYDHEGCVWFLSAKREFYSSHPENHVSNDDDDPPVELVGTVLSTATFQNRSQGTHLLLTVQLVDSPSKKVVFAVSPNLLTLAAVQGEKYFLGRTALLQLLENTNTEEMTGEISRFSLVSITCSFFCCFPSVYVNLLKWVGDWPCVCTVGVIFQENGGFVGVFTLMFF